MATHARIDSRTRTNWLVVGVVMASAIAAGLSGIYFLYFPSGGSRSGPIALSQSFALLGRETWNDVHMWGGVLMIVAIAVHFILHWRWVTMTSRRLWVAARQGGVKFSQGSRINLAINVVIAVSFLLTAISGLYFLFGPEGGFQGGRNPAWDPGFLFSRSTWDMVHTWSAVIMMSAAAAHLWIHWRWVDNVTKRVIQSATTRRAAGGRLAAVPAEVRVESRF